MSVTKVNCIHALLDRLDQIGAEYRLGRLREDALMVEVFAPGEHWEIEFFVDGHIEVERFRSNGEIADESAFHELFDVFGGD
jgi:hypothetical protein